MKKFSLIILSLVLVLSLTACGEDTVQSVIEDARDFIEDVTSVHCSAMTGMDMQSDENHISSLLAMESDMDIEHKTNYVNMVSSSNDEEEVAIEMYVDSSSTPPKYYVGSGDRWLQMDKALPQTDVELNSDLSRDFGIYFDELSMNAETEMVIEELEGVNYYKLHAPVTIRSLDMAKQFSMDSFITGVLGENATQETINSVLSMLGAVDVTVYINCDTYEPYGFVLDLKPALDGLYQNLKAEGVTITEAYASAVYTYYNESEVEIPEKVLNAQKMSDVANQMGKGE